MTFDEQRVRAALRQAWSMETAVQWKPDNPALGQCNVTAAVIHDLFGGEVLRTWLSDVWHYYNRINGQRYDLTDNQFTKPGALFNAPAAYDNALSDRDAAMDAIPQREYDTLRSAFLNHYNQLD